MKELLRKLRSMNEEIIGMDIELFKNICLASVDFNFEGDDIAEYQKSGEVINVHETTVETGQNVYTVDYELINICDEETFNEIIDSSAQEYRFKHINDFLEPFFNDNTYYKACKEDKGLRDLILEEENDIKDYEEVTFENINYVIFR